MRSRGDRCVRGGRGRSPWCACRTFRWTCQR